MRSLIGGEKGFEVIRIEGLEEDVEGRSLMENRVA